MSKELSPAAYEHAFPVTPSDTNNIRVTRAIYIGGPTPPGQTADIRVTMFGGETVTFVNVLAGTVIPISATRVWETDTTATGIIGLY